MSDVHTPEPRDGGPQPFDGYDRLKPREVNKALSEHSQDDLEGIERYERANKQRPSILDKLRYMRGRQPLPGYDQLAPEEIVTALRDADVETIKRVRDYERKFANRPEVLEEAARVHREARAESAPPEAPAYAPQSAREA